MEVPADRAHDPREQAEWFERLPEHARGELRDLWRRAELSEAEAKKLRFRVRRRYVAESLLLFLVAAAMPPFTGHPLVVAVVGTSVGAVASLLRAGPFLYCVVGAVGSALAFGPWQFFALCFVASGSAALGAIHEFQRADRTEPL